MGAYLKIGQSSRKTAIKNILKSYLEPICSPIKEKTYEL